MIDENNSVLHIVVLGGGSAGWLSAGILAAKYKNDPSVSVHLVESEAIPVIGVGEGTWPTMRTSLEKIGISETHFMRYCMASFKQGSKFVNWRVDHEDDFYYHPFTAPAADADFNFVDLWAATEEKDSFSFFASMQPALCELNKAPKQKTTPEYAGVLNYGYHLDSAKFGLMLKEHCIDVLGVLHTVGTVLEVNSDARTGYIKNLKLKDGSNVQGDLFIDCSGSSSLLIGQHFQSPFIDKSHYSANNRAIATQIPCSSKDQPVDSSTIATAQECGWTWDIGLSHRRGVGYVYSDTHTSNERAYSVLANYLKQTDANVKVSDLSFKEINIRPGHRKEFWVKNCVAVGMSAGFIEPLEASALALVELSGNMIRDNLPRTRESMEIIAKRFNNIFTYRWERIVEFLKLHYVLTDRQDSEYWRDVSAKESCPEELIEKLLLWKERGPNHYDFLHSEEIFPSASYEYVLYGMESRSKKHDLMPDKALTMQAKSYLSGMKHTQEKLIMHLPSNRELLDFVSHSEFKKI